MHPKMMMEHMVRTTTIYPKEDAALTALVFTLLLIIQHPNNVIGQIPDQTSKTMILYNSGNFSGAISMLNKSLAVNPHNVYALLDLGLSYDNIGNHSAAAIFYNKVIKEAGSNPQYATQRGVALDGLGGHIGAIKFLQSSLEDYPA